MLFFGGESIVITLYNLYGYNPLNDKAVFPPIEWPNNVNFSIFFISTYLNKSYANNLYDIY